MAARSGSQDPSDWPALLGGGDERSGEKGARRAGSGVIRGRSSATQVPRLSSKSTSGTGSGRGESKSGVASTSRVLEIRAEVVLRIVAYRLDPREAHGCSH
jgi:hypothetical protein